MSAGKLTAERGRPDAGDGADAAEPGAALVPVAGRRDEEIPPGLEESEALD